MHVVLRYFDGCPNWLTARARLRAALDTTEHPDVAIDLQQVQNHADAERLCFAGSPTILIDGIDPFGEANGPYGLACRVYRTPEGLRGSPTFDSLVAVIAAVTRTSPD